MKARALPNGYLRDKLEHLTTASTEETPVLRTLTYRGQGTIPHAVITDAAVMNDNGYEAGPSGHVVTLTNDKRFTATEWRDVQALVNLLGDETPTLLGSRHVVWPALCAAMARWHSTLVANRASLLTGGDVSRCTLHP